MHYYYEDKADCTIYYKVQRLKWSLCCVYFSLSEVFELTFIPTLYRAFFDKGERPTFLEWLGRHPRWWSKRLVFPKGTRFYGDSRPDITLGRLYRIEWGTLFDRY